MVKVGDIGKGYMCMVHFQYELEGDANGTPIYPSVEALRDKHISVDECGIVEVEVKVTEIVQPENFQIPDWKEYFRCLTQQWKDETALTSSITEIVTNGNYQAIIGMGRKVVPLIIEELRADPHWWFWALTAITGASPTTDLDRGHMSRMRRAWLNWWEEHKGEYNADV